ncbi:histidine triad (HIT) protein [Marinobacter santoriniensis NKSG1]|uniref:Histidine triad (HIT) protein n=1 Tax=Marinobacter santoriniensis NKSG1 TaxID=1288826 RepID=M7CTY3_9GAMM|nr:HIT family protein [Marinobacter santoriniensis]EMP55640.1 histidine triad (HIT) protein [Marinobacter santoriniensis NKSG1]
MMGEGFVIHERLAADTILLGHSRLCEVRLMNESTWPWVLLVPASPDIREIYELSEEQQLRLMMESSRLSRGMMDAFSGDKMNVAALGNMVPQLHIHHIVRYCSDPAWPGPVWGTRAPTPYTPDELDRFRARMSPILKTLA